jgi:hypothetical protein
MTNSITISIVLANRRLDRGDDLAAITRCVLEHFGADGRCHPS